MKTNRYAKRLSVLLLAVCLLCLQLVACSSSSKGKTLLTLEKDGQRATVSVNLYELMLSRVKGALVGNGSTSGGYSPSDSAYWNTVGIFGESEKSQTLAEFYSALILENCKTYVAAEWLFQSEGLTLSDSAIADVDERMQDLVDGYGTKTKLNAVLADYGVNYAMLREAYLLEAKVSALQTHFFGSDASLVDYSLKDRYLNEHYVRFFQINLPLFRYQYVTDKNGDAVWYVQESQLSKIAYDTANGVRHEDPDHPGDYLTDENDDEIWFKSATSDRIAYDMENGIRSYVLDSNGAAKTEELTAGEIAEVQKQAQSLLAELEGASDADFESKMKELNVYAAGEDQYTDGYYLNLDTDYAAAGDDFQYLSEIVGKLADAKVGDVALVETSDALHIVRKYEPTSGAYDKDVNEPWFTTFNSQLVEDLFLEKCQSLFAYITVDETVLASATDIRRIGSNLYLY